jgi:hypothetical protein
MAISASKAIKAIEGSGGFVTQIAKRLDCSRKHFYSLMDKYPTVREALEDEREKLKDMTEGELLKKIRGGNMTAIIFYLKTQAKDRGYVERHDLTTLGEKLAGPTIYLPQVEEDGE